MADSSSLGKKGEKLGISWIHLKQYPPKNRRNPKHHQGTNATYPSLGLDFPHVTRFLDPEISTFVISLKRLPAQAMNGVKLNEFLIEIDLWSI